MRLSWHFKIKVQRKCQDTSIGCFSDWRILFTYTSVNSLWPNNVIWCQHPWSSLVQWMAWHLTGAKPLPELMTIFGNFTPKKLNGNYLFMRIDLKMSYAKNGSHLVPCVSRYSACLTSQRCQHSLLLILFGCRNVPVNLFSGYIPCGLYVFTGTLYIG